MEIDPPKLNSEQRKAVTHEKGPLLIVAGAGTGKTTVITQRISWLIREKGLKPDEILALTFTEKAAQEMEERVDRALPMGYVDLWVSTFHAFCEKILQQHAVDIGLPNDFHLLNQTDGWLLVKKHFDRFELDYYKPLGNPTKFIHALLRHFSRCKDEEIYPEDYLKYAEELKMNLDSMESTGGKRTKSEIQKTKSKINSKSKKQKSNTNQDARSQIPDLHHDGEIATQEVSRINEIANAYHTYQQLLLDNNALDFGDLINYTLKLFKTRPGIRARYQKQFKHILVDEFQDTNWAQYELIKLLASLNNNITVVGDDDQAIYKFRGASVSNILYFKKDFPRAREVFLNTNYRSRQNILNLSYQFIQLNNPERLEVKLAEALERRGGRAAAAKRGKFTKKLTAHRRGKAEIIHHHAPDLAAEVAWTVDQIERLFHKDKDASWNDFAILVRANQSAKDFVQELEARGVPYQFLASRGLYTKPLVLDIINYLRLLDEYCESPALYRILKMPVIRISDWQINQVLYWARRKNWSIFETLSQIATIPKVEEKTIAQAQKLLALLEKHKRLAKEKSVRPVIVAFLHDTGYLDYIQKLPEEKTLEQFHYLNQFDRAVQAFERSAPDIAVTDFLNEIELELEAGEQGSLSFDVDAGPESVKVMTIHSAKGLEFRYVFIPNLVDRRFPTVERKDPIEVPLAFVKEILPKGDIHLQEERRLFYVACTRARDGLFLTSAKDYGGQRAKKPSRFLKELGFVPDGGNMDKEQQPSAFKRSAPVAPSSRGKTAYRLPQHFSYTQLKAFETCPLQYKYAHILRVPVKGKHTFSFGKTIHKTLQQFFLLAKERAAHAQEDLFSAKTPSKKDPHQKARIKKLVSLEELLKLYDKNWIDDWYNDKQHSDQYRKKGQEALQRFYRDVGEEASLPLYVEKEFRLKVGDYILKGVMDRVDPAQEGGIEIVDYKTGTPKKKSPVSFETKEQLLMYQMAAEQAGDAPVKQLTYYYINDGSTISFVGSEKDIALMRKKIVETIERIASSDFKASPSPQHCGHCDFKSICPFRAV